MSDEGKTGVELESVQLDVSGGTQEEGKCCRCLPCKHGKKGKAHGAFMEYSDRRCTNLLCLIIYALFMIAWAAIGFMAFQYGTPDM